VDDRIDRTLSAGDGVSRERDVRRRGLAAAAGVALAMAGILAIASIPRGPREFQYRDPTGGSAFWPLPFAPINGFTPEQLSSHVARALFFLPACVCLGIAFRRARLWRRLPHAALIPVVGAGLTAAIAVFVTRGVPLQDDEPTYLMQAELLMRGLIADPSYSPAAAFAEPFTIFSRAGMTGMYLFGAPAILAIGLPLGVPWLGVAAIVALTLWAVYDAARRSGDRAVAWLGSFLLAVSPMLTFTSATALSQAPVLAGLAVAVLGLVRGGWQGGAPAGTGFGLACAARPQTAVPVAIVLAALYAWRDRRLLVAMVLAGLPWVAAIALYDQALMGHATQLPRAGYTGELESYGFGTVLRHYEHTPWKAMALGLVVLVRLNGWALGWPLSLAGPAAWLALGRPHRLIVMPWAVVALTTFLVQAGYASIGTSETGPIYHYTALPFVTLATAAALREAAVRRWGGWVHAAAVASLLLGTTTFYVEHAARLMRLTRAIEGPRQAMTVERPTVLFEDVWPDRPQFGWVFGIPFRDRAPSSRIVRYPRPARHRQLESLVARWSDRDCRYLWYDWHESSYQLSDCKAIDAIDRTRGAAPEIDPVVTRPDGTPWFEEGGWVDAFPYLPVRAFQR
jgi:hypothetical protein